jgi:uncharacterized membrane protein
MERSSRGMIVLLVVVLLYVGVFTVLSLVRYNTFHATTFDLGIMTQVVWNTAHGRWFETSIGRAANAELIGSYLGNHVRPILLFLAPLYRLWPDPRLLLILQSMALGGAALPLYWITLRQTKDVKASLLVACCYLGYPALGFLNLVDFHPIVFSIPFVFLAYWALQEERICLFWVAVLLALSTKEEMVIPMGVWGVVNLFQGRRRVGLGLVALAGIWAVVCFGFVIPYFNDGQSYRFLRLWSQLPGLSSLGSGDGGPVQSIGRASFETIVLFLLHLFLPLGYLPFLGPASFVVSLPSLVYLLLGKRPAFQSVGYQYPAVLIPWLFLAVVEGLRWARRKCLWLGGRRFYRLGLAFLVVGTVGINVPLNPIALYARHGEFRSEPYHAQVEDALAQIPPEVGVATINQLGPPLTNRRVFMPLEYPPPLRLDHLQAVDYVLLDLVDCRYVTASDPRAGYADIVSQVLDTTAFRVRYWSDRILLLERGTPTQQEVEAIMAYEAWLVERNRSCWP